MNPKQQDLSSIFRQILWHFWYVELKPSYYLNAKAHPEFYPKFIKEI